MESLKQLKTLLPFVSTMTPLALASYTAVGGAVLWYLLSFPKKKKAVDTVCDGKLDLLLQLKGHHTIHRQSMLANGKVMDHGDSVVYVTNPEFELNSTIYKTLEGGVPRAWMRSKLAVDVYWNDDVASEITKACSHIPFSLDHNKNIIDFMQDECNFICEHNEGSFMDHLQFVYDFAKNYYREQSPRVLLLHSIMGVATNIFPMEVKKEGKLKSLLTDAEYKHIQAFPSVLRLLLTWQLLEELGSCSPEKLKTLKGISFHRCLDNKKMELTAEEFWIHLNFHLIHFLDFLPVANWKLSAGELTLQAFTEIHKLLTRTDHLFAKVDLDLSDPSATAAMPVSLASVMYNVAPASAIKHLSIRSVKKFSAKINHSTQYELLW
eukprot:m.25897 g.25897  ORF g.25897 m.25897 type:complete len:379 (-) comp15201_c0_seq1:289-1425(-)